MNADKLLSVPSEQSVCIFREFSGDPRRIIPLTSAMDEGCPSILKGLCTAAVSSNNSAEVASRSRIELTPDAKMEVETVGTVILQKTRSGLANMPLLPLRLRGETDTASFTDKNQH
eukprot:CAMPEP_0170570302 /NCGR_PEP_ID=MMETSP0224-20130122/1034_1 /TAXON_ID=285029 /ORGANISM="Togula jolla, Strain CCCM 725" /LENGTH=115 /DNA_ID=CAMNT_0010892563 /DNA_START=117 /DNA_END=462 /DNA_ORIENTATION=-